MMPTTTDPEQVCWQLLEAAGHRAPPTDLHAICSLWPDLRVEEENLDQEGYLIPLGIHGAEILLRKHDPPARKKFTLAHELGHWTRAHLKAGKICLGKTTEPNLSFQSHQKRHTPEEIWCNKFAACLLMPYEDIRSYLQDSKGGNIANRVSRGHSVFQVARDPFLNRISDTTSINIFEVVSADTRTRIRRSFLSNFQYEASVKQTLDELLHLFRDKRDPFENQTVVNNYQISSKLTHSSRYSSSWLVLIASVADIDWACQEETLN